jgi:hypothetical protein
MDGTTYDQLPDSGLSRPFMFLGTQAEHSPGQDSMWDHDFSRLTGWRRWLTVTGAAHNSFADYGTFADEIGLDLGATITGLRSIEITPPVHPGHVRPAPSTHPAATAGLRVILLPRGGHRGEVVSARACGPAFSRLPGTGRSPRRCAAGDRPSLQAPTSPQGFWEVPVGGRC